jgi:hypothetical protein
MAMDVNDIHKEGFEIYLMLLISPAREFSLLIKSNIFISRLTARLFLLKRKSVFEKFENLRSIVGVYREEIHAR